MQIEKQVFKMRTYLFGCKIVQFECSKIAKQRNLYHVNLQNNAVCEKYFVSLHRNLIKI